MMNLDLRRFNFIGILTALVVLGYVAASVLALWQSRATWTEFSGAIGPIAGLLLGYWVRGDQP